jgi:hypothetical protein
MKSFVFMIFLAGWASPASAVSLEQLIAAGEAEHGLSAAVNATSASLLGTPYLLGNAGEGHRDVFDQDPLWRLDVFDCTTYVETVIAASLAHDRAGFEKELFAVRYLDGEVKFTSRNHFPEVDWIPNNERNGIVRDLTISLFPSLARSIAITIDKPRWYVSMKAESIEPRTRPLAEREALAARLRAYAPRTHAEKAVIPYLPMEQFFVRGANGERLPNKAVLSRIPTAAIFNVVREGWAPGGLPQAISHQGFVVQKADGTYMRHASEGRGVVEDRLDLYFAKFLGSATIRGINLLGIQAR